MTSAPEHNVKLPKFVIDSELCRVFRAKVLNHLSAESQGEPIVFDWSGVCFFDDYALLKLVFLQRQLRAQGCRVTNSGFGLAPLFPNMPAIIRQLWAVGLPELMASGHLFGREQLMTVLQDDAGLLESDPLYGNSTPSAVSPIVPMLCCHDRKHFTPGSREEKQLDTFIRGCLRPTGTLTSTWDLMENREFRHLMLQQLRRNVQEHSRRDDQPVVGLAIVRVWTARTLSDEWGLTTDVQAQLLQTWGQEPVPTVLRSLSVDQGVLQISVVDDGAGIPHNLESVHKQMCIKTMQQEFFHKHERLHYNNAAFDERFADPALWEDSSARLIAFAMDELGTSKPDRASEVKGLQYLRESAAQGGAIVIESDGFAVGHVTQILRFGKPRKVEFNWCQKGGTGVCFAAPMTPVESNVSPRKRHSSTLGITTGTGTKAEQLRIRDHLHRTKIKMVSEQRLSDFLACAKVVLDKIQLQEYEDDVTVLRRKGLLVVDWGELDDSKRTFHHLLVAIAKGLAAIDPRRMRPFVFANLPLGLCGLLRTAINTYSTREAPIPICAFASEQREHFWLGLDGENSLDGELRSKVECELRRKLTDHKENRTEAFHRECLTNMLAQAGGVAPSDNSVLSSVEYGSREAVLQSPAFSRLNALVRRCPLLREQETPSIDGELCFTGRYCSVFQFSEIADAVRELFLDEFRDILTTPPVCFIPPDANDGIELPNSTRRVARFFRSDALVDSPIATELAQELSAIAFDIARRRQDGRIDWVVTCTTPLHWFVHKIVDGLAEREVKTSHYVFPSYDAIPVSLEDIHMRAGDSVLAFTDVIASGQTTYRMAASLVDHFGVSMAGLIALADTRTAEDRKSGPPLEHIYRGTIVCLYNKPESPRSDLKRAYYVHPETVVPKRVVENAGTPEKHFFDTNFAGVGPLVEKHAYFNVATPTLNLMKSLGAVRMGHFQHGSHHSEVFVDVERVFSCRDYRNLLVTTLFRYILTHEIRLVLYPSHSSAYMLVDDLKERFIPSDSSVEFIMACRTFRGTQGSGYSLTRFSPHSESEWRKYSNCAILILDDAVCSGATVESIIAELARIDRNYYDRHDPPPPRAANCEFAVHVVAFLNRLPRVTTGFWRGLSQVTAGRVEFSACITIPLVANPAETCPECRLLKKLDHAMASTSYCHYAKEFLSWWCVGASLVNSDEWRHSDAAAKGSRFRPDEVLRIAGYLSAIERKGYSNKWVRPLLVDKTPGTDGAQESVAVRVHVRSRAGFLHDLLPVVSKDPVADLCKELESLIVLTLDANGDLRSEDDVLEILRVLIIRYLRIRPTQDEAEQVAHSLLTKLAPAFDSRLVVGGIACVLDACLKWFAPPESVTADWESVRARLRARVRGVRRDNLSARSSLVLDWFNMYLAEGGKGIGSVGQAVLMLAEYAKKGAPNHFYGRHEIDELRETFEDRPASAAPAGDASATVRRVLICTDHFSQLVSATRVLQSASFINATDLLCLQNETEQDIQKLRGLCSSLLNSDESQEMLRDYLEVKSLFLRVYRRWFPEGERPKASEVIGNFTLNLRTSLVSAWENFTPTKKRSKKSIQMDLSDCDRHNSMMVLVDPVVLDTTMRQLLDNVVKLAAPDEPVAVKCQVMVSGNNSSVAQGKVAVIVSNTGTPCPDVGQIKPRGLATASMRLSEFGGTLVYDVPKTVFSFQVTMQLMVWMEGEQ